MKQYSHSKAFIKKNNKAINKLINKDRIKILLKNGYNLVDIKAQTIIQSNGTISKIEQWDIDYYEDLHNMQKKRGLI